MKCGCLLLPIKVAQFVCASSEVTTACLNKLIHTETAELQQQYRIVHPRVAESLQTRARNLLEHGFAEALRREQVDEKERFYREDSTRLLEAGSDTLKNWFWNVWRPDVPITCVASRPTMTPRL